MKNNPVTYANQILLDANVLAATLAQAISELQTALAGYPTSVSGAGPSSTVVIVEAGPCQSADCAMVRPCPEHDAPERSTATERAALAGDRARDTLAELVDHVRKASFHVRRSAAISQVWGTQRLDKSAVASMIVAIDAGIWCANCSKHGFKNTRKEGHQLCEFCQRFSEDWKRRPSKRILEVRSARNGRIYEQDIRRIHAEEDAQAKALKGAKGKSGRGVSTASR